jgi:hypothetical protein
MLAEVGAYEADDASAYETAGSSWDAGRAW